MTSRLMTRSTQPSWAVGPARLPGSEGDRSSRLHGKRRAARHHKVGLSCSLEGLPHGFPGHILSKGDSGRLEKAATLAKWRVVCTSKGFVGGFGVRFLVAAHTLDKTVRSVQFDH